MTLSNFSLVEPQRSSVSSKGAYFGGGRGGAGNYRRYTAEELPAGSKTTLSTTRIPFVKPSKRIMSSGRGGVGNMFVSEAEESIFQFDEEMARRSETKAPVYHIGRGGAANWVDESKTLPAARKPSVGSVKSETSEDSNDSTARRSTEKMFSLFGRRSS